MVAEPPTVVAVIVAVSANHPMLRSARKKPWDVFAFRELIKPTKKITAIYAMSIPNMSSEFIVNHGNVHG